MYVKSNIKIITILDCISLKAELFEKRRLTFYNLINIFRSFIFKKIDSD